MIYKISLMRLFYFEISHSNSSSKSLHYIFTQLIETMASRMLPSNFSTLVKVRNILNIHQVEFLRVLFVTVRGGLLVSEF